MIGQDQYLQEELYNDSNISTINCDQLKQQNAFHNLIIIQILNSQQQVEGGNVLNIKQEAQKLTTNHYLLIEAKKDQMEIRYFILLFDHHNNLNNVQQGMQILVYGNFDNNNTIYFSQRLKNDHFYVLEPKTLVSATKLSNIVYCRRKPLVKEFFSNQVFGTNFNKLRGNFLHYIFQNLMESIYEFEKYFQQINDSKQYELDINQIPVQFKIFFEQNQSKFLKEIYTVGNEKNKDMEISISQGFIKILIWIKKFVINKQPIQQNKFQIQIIKWVANEKKIQSSVLGLVGVIDMIFEVKIIIDKYQQRFCKIPIEIKTGMKLNSDDTQVQTYIYLMNNYYEQETLLGMILYLNNSDYKIITNNQYLQKDLLFCRNLYILELCQLKKQEDFSLLPKLELEIKTKQEQMKCEKCGCKYVCYGLFLLENQSTFQFPIQSYEQIKKQVNQQTKIYLNEMIKNLRQEKKAQTLTQIEYEIKQKQNLNDTFHYILSSKNTYLESQALQVLKECFPSNREFTLFCKRTQKSYQFILKKQPNIIQKYLLNQTSRLENNEEDDFEYLIRMHVQVKTELSTFGKELEIEDILIQQIQQKNPFKHYNFITFELAINQKLSRKKEILILGYTPQFKSQSYLHEGDQQSFSQMLDNFKQLNEQQSNAIQLCLLAEDFVLIQGYNGKRNMLSHLLFLLGQKNKNILFCSADDDILDEQINDFSETFPNECGWILRLYGEKEQIQEKYQKYSFDFKKFEDISEINKKLKNKHFYFSTCQNCTDILQSDSFDYCIVDQSTKIIEPSCISCILKSKVFILLQDQEFEQPQVQSKDAKLLQVSLFQRLSQQFKNIGCLVDLDQGEIQSQFL
ncbi:unnamed protein product [Paramecium pentaurelia]|uniref:DNA replication factor Dna2 N-terminal domain-containing protein n=1 Tax=Paramecium pentaurelia TaxID=43138 RepID=A0A8S1WJI6_9CILI|nr:unnamed protein product [Paramecium pentaurelia]